MNSPILFGTDFDNTIVSYDHLFQASAREMGVEVPSHLTTKAGIRDYIRSLPRGEILWQKIQADVYGPRMSEARIIDGFDAFISRCREHAIPVFIVSHKTKFAAQDREINLRFSALTWMEANGFFDRKRLGFLPSEVFFEATRESKITKIRNLRCSHFVDDMEEVLLHDGFPENIVKILIAKNGQGRKPKGVTALSSWCQIADHLFG